MALNDIAKLTSRIVDSRHPAFITSLLDWEKWRLTYEGGDGFLTKYLEKFTTREDNIDFQVRRRLTPIPSFAKSAINEIRDAIFQRMRDISRAGGSQAYRNAVAGEDLGVDRRGSSMNAFLGMKVLSEILVMGRVGIYVDNPVVAGDTLADTQGVRPYLYAYQVEDILSWSCTSPENPSEFQSLLLRDTCLNYDERTLLPLTTFQRFRLLWLDPNTGKVNLQFYDLNGQEVNREGLPSTGPTELDLTRIPFVMPQIGDSLIKDVCQHQIALLNLASRDVWYALQSNFPFYVEQRDMRAMGGHLKQAATADGTATTGGQGAANTNIDVGPQHGRAYDLNADAPSFIHPSAEPLRASIALQEKLEADIQKLVHLAVHSLPAQSPSAASKALDNAGLEAGLSHIGLILESTERAVAQHWASYENRNPEKQSVATIKYPDQYSLETDLDRVQKSDKLLRLMIALPGRQVKREIQKTIARLLLGGKVNVATLDKIMSEIDKSKYLTSDPNTIIQAVEAGLCGEQTGSEALGFDPEEYKQARDDHALRAQRILEAQAGNTFGPTTPKGSKQAGYSLTDPGLKARQQLETMGARGVPDLGTNPNAGSNEKTASRDNTLRAGKRRRIRGRGAKTRVTGEQPTGA